MADVKSILSKRFEKGAPKSTKMDLMASQTSKGALSSFAGVFKVHDLTEKEKQLLSELLKNYSNHLETLERDLEDLSAITSEVKAISNQAIILHGERIKKAHALLTQYKDGAFSSWLLATYGNRQTPYNFLQYYEFYISLSEELQKQIDLMPKQVIYSLASRDGSKEAKQKFILEFCGQTKQELLSHLRDVFPLEDHDKRRGKLSEQVILQLNKLISSCMKSSFKPTLEEKQEILKKLDQLRLLSLKK